VSALVEDLGVREPVAGRIWHHRNRGWSMRLVHRHAELEVNVVVRGTASYQIFDRRVDLARHSLIFLFPEQEHILFNSSPDFEMWIWVIRPDVLRKMCTPAVAEPLCQGNPPGLFSRPIAPAAARELVATIRSAHAQEGRDVDSFNSGLLHATVTAWRAWREPGSDADRGAALHPTVEEAARLLAEDDLSLPQLAKRLRVSPTHLSRLFHRQLGVRLVDYRNRMRIHRFLETYGQGDRLTMLSAALAAGFGSYPQFNRVFRQVMGASPSTYCRRGHYQG
jgi:methylphosphotriester-DNA--protein-cysteine methyltransferase